MKYILFLFILTGCSSNEQKYRHADNLILCNPITNEAYNVQPGAGDSSVVVRIEKLDKVCQYAAGDGDEPQSEK